MTRSGGPRGAALVVGLMLFLSACSPGAGAASVPASVALPSATASPSPRPSSTPGIDDIVIERFLERIAAPEFTAHVVIDAGVAVAGGTATFDATVDIDGPNSHAKMKSVIEGDSTTFEAIVVKGVSYTRLGRDRFARNRTYREAYTVNPFFHLGAGARSLRYGGQTMAGDIPAHDLQLDGAFLIHPLNLGPSNVSDARLQHSEFHVLVSDEGVPVRGTLRFIGAARVGRQLQELKIDATYAFSEVGTEIVVKVPG